MKLLELNALLEHRNRPVQTNKSILQYFHIWKGLRKRFGDNDELEAFLAGYTLGTNVILREKYIAAIKQEEKIEKRDEERRLPYWYN